MKPWSILLFLYSFAMAVCIARAVDLTVLSGDQNRELADENRLFRVSVPGKRGVILDRDGNVLVANTPQYFLATGSASKLFADIWSLPEISPEEALRVRAASPSSVFFRSRRDSPVSASLVHVIGFTGFADSLDVLDQRYENRVGKSGVEKSFEPILRGKSGTQLIEISAKGVMQRSIVMLEDPQAGTDVTLSVDKHLSDVAAVALAGEPGAVVVSDIPSGQVLTLISSPSYSVASISSALTDQKKPLINRSITAFPPGSTFKPMVALAALQAGTITAQTQFEDTGEIKAGESVFGNWYWRQYGKVEGNISLVRALARSNDIYFYKTAESVGPDKIDAMAGQFGFGKSTGLELPGEAAGLLPNSAWKEKKIGDKWFLGDTYNLGIGQGYLLATPVQVNNMTATLARHGSWCPLTLKLSKDPLCTDVQIDSKYIDEVIEGMVGVCNAGGTAFPFFPLTSTLPEEKKIACKTGTAEFGATLAQGKKRTHGWFTMFYPKQKPKVAITVFVESTDDHPFLEGSTNASPIALKVFQAWKEKYDK
ncbi:MAG: penicillin-binding transpeptidase domain-containing protein [Candidatus Woesebacteria bacterium]